MERRMLGRTGHESSVVALGGAALWSVSQANSDRTMELILGRGVNHIDVAPEYGDAEARVGEWMPRFRKQVFLACKTLMRTKKEAREELLRSLERLKTDIFDLYQLHAVDTLQELDTVLGPGGAMEAILEARENGLVRHIGITGHSLDTHLAALERFDFDTVMFPFNFIFYSSPAYRADFDRLMALAAERDIGVMIIKAIAKGNWEPRYQKIPFLDRPYTTWYRPFDTRDEIVRSLAFVLTQAVATAVGASDLRLLPLLLDAAESYTSLNGGELERVAGEGGRFKQLRFTF